MMAAIASSACTPHALEPAGSPSQTDRVEPPTMLRGDVPRITGMEEMDAKIEVLIDANGEPVMSTLKITGRVGGNGRFALESWIRDAAFLPAKRGGTPVAGLFTMQLRRTVR